MYNKLIIFLQDILTIFYTILENNDRNTIEFFKHQIAMGIHQNKKGFLFVDIMSSGEVV